MALSVRSRLWAGLAAGVLTVAASAAATAGAAQASSTPGPNTPEKVSTGLLASSLPGASAFGNTSPSTPEQVSFILKERDISQLESAVTGGKTSFDSVSQFAGKYGQSSAVVSALTGYLAKFGITTTVYPGNVDVSASGTAGEFDQALTVKQQNYHVPARHGFDGGVGPGTDGLQRHRSAGVAVRDRAVRARGTRADQLRTVLQPRGSPELHDQPPLMRRPPRTLLVTTCRPTSPPTTGLTPLYKKANGSGETIGIVTLAALDVGAPEYFWQNVANVPATGRTVSVDNVDGGPGAPSDAAGTGETDLDVEQSGGLAPGANVIVYQAPNTDPGFIDGFFTAASQNVADTLSSSWGESETFVAGAVAAGEETATYEAAFDEAFLELADQGQSAFVSSGDAGAYAASRG